MVDTNSAYIDPDLDAISCLPDSTYDRPAKQPSFAVSTGKRRKKQPVKAKREKTSFTHTLPYSIEQQQQQVEEAEEVQQAEGLQASAALYMQPVKRGGHHTAAFTALGSAIAIEEPHSSSSTGRGSRPINRGGSDNTSHSSDSSTISTIGTGLQDLVFKLETTLSSAYLSKEYFLPYSASIVPRILESCVVHQLRYTEMGVYIRAKIPPHMATMLQNFQV